MIEFLTGPFGAAAWYGMIASVALMSILAATNLLFGLSERTRRVGAFAMLALGAPIMLWLPLFYGSALFYGNFNGDWRGVVMCIVLTAISLPMAALPFLAFRKVITSSARS
jgi:hypothetical protein